MLLGLGAHVLWRLWRDRVHFHKHGHGDGTVHFTPIATPARPRRMSVPPTRMNMASAGARCWSG